MWKEIVKVRFDHGVAYVRLPNLWVKEQGLKRGDYVVVTENAKRGLDVDNFETVVKNAKRIEDDSGGGSGRPTVSDAD